MTASRARLRAPLQGRAARSAPVWRWARRRSWVLHLLVALHVWLGVAGAAWAASGRPTGWRDHSATQRIELGRAVMRYEPHLEDEAEALAEVIPQWWVEIERALATNVDDTVEIVLVDHAGRVSEATSMPTWAAGVAHPPSGRIIVARHGPDGSRTHLPSLLKHEMAHVIVHRAAGGTKLPRWFQEGVAESFEGGISLSRAQTLAGAVFGAGLPKLSRWDDAFGAQAEHADVSAAYAGARDFVTFLRTVDDSGASLRQVLMLLRKGEGFEASFSAAYGETLVELHHRWSRGLRQRMIWFPLIASGSLPFFLVGPLVIAAWIRRRAVMREKWRRLELEDAAADTFTGYQPHPA